MLSVWMSMAREMLWAPWLIVVCYLSCIFKLESFMKTRPPYDLRPALFIWNSFLTLFSAVGLFYTAPSALLNFPNTCNITLNETASVWMTLFMVSKTPELFDTAFLVLRKRKISFLHTFHHASVLVYCWTAYAFESPIGIYFTVMNYAVHFLMYAYYALAVYGKPIWGNFITTIQILQMALGLAITVRASFFGCEPFVSLSGAAFLYAVYLKLFVDFFANKLSSRKIEHKKL
jgi:hypothetical protein